MVVDFEESKREPLYPGTQQVKFADEILGKVVIIEDFERLPGETGEFFVVKADLGGKMVSFATGSKVLMKQIEKLKTDGKLPCRCKTEKPKGKDYYTIISPKEVV